MAKLRVFKHSTRHKSQTENRDIGYPDLNSSPVELDSPKRKVVKHAKEIQKS
ncbi:hypothetical protein LCGC14_2888100 [marine sediment metagenome]|uniref:Uncharacterized protein n=1 Tax=marine sediment metagenome TaxID=412755 RepID=A0A0F9AP75_9ZZZZ